MSDLVDLTACYSNIAAPRRTERGVDPTLGYRDQLRLFATGARAGIHRPDLAAHLLAHADQAPMALVEQDDRTEYFWFLFSQKSWLKLLQAAQAMGGLGDLPLHVADLVWLAFYRSQSARVLAGTDAADFIAAGKTLLALLRTTWPHADDRHALYAAMLAHVIGRVDQARQVFVAYRPSVPLIEPVGAVQTVLPASDPSRTADSPARARMRQAAAERVALISLDHVYFGKYARQVAVKFFQSNPGNGLHLHCVGFDPAAAIASWGLDGAIGWTIDDTDLGALSERGKRGYYAAARYIFLADYLRLYRNVFVADVDGLMLRDIAELDEEHAADDIVLSTLVLNADRQLNRLPWESITACAFMARRTPGGLQFATAMQGYLLEIMRRSEHDGTPFWYADQTALYYCWRDFGQAVRFGRFQRPAFKQVGSWKLFQGDAERLQFLDA